MTGASRGIGFGIATRLAQHGYGLTITGRNAQTLATARTALIQAGAPRVVLTEADMGNEADLGPIVEAHAAEFASLNALILSAGVGTSGSIAEFPISRFDKTWAVNVRAAFLLIQRSLPVLRKAAADDTTQPARIVAIASITGVYSEPTLAAYGATKAALLSLISSVNAEEAANGVLATALAPGYVDSDMSEWVRDVIPPDDMITINDVVEVADALLRLSRNTVIPSIVMSRSRSDGHQA